jgi:hypothetical protein
MVCMWLLSRALSTSALPPPPPPKLCRFYADACESSSAPLPKKQTHIHVHDNSSSPTAPSLGRQSAPLGALHRGHTDRLGLSRRKQTHDQPQLGWSACSCSPPPSQVKHIDCPPPPGSRLLLPANSWGCTCRPTNKLGHTLGHAPSGGLHQHVACVHSCNTPGLPEHQSTNA